jgi:glycosyltransferase involved in cell wall biosynthesis
MAAGLPVVACRAAAVPEVVLEGRTGLLIPPRDPQALAAALEQVLRHPTLGKELGEAGRRAVAGFTPARVAQRFLDTVRSVARGPISRGAGRAGSPGGPEAEERRQ